MKRNYQITYSRRYTKQNTQISLQNVNNIISFIE